MAIEEHPGWREFPLEIGQAVRSDQINALWWALSERGALVGSAPIETNFGIFDSETGDFDRYRGDSRLCLVKGGGESELRAFEHLSALRGNVTAILTLFINPEIRVVTGEEAEADEDLTEGDIKDPPFINWTLSDILKFLELGGPQEGFSSSDPDALFTFTRIPDREDQVIGKDENDADVKFNDFFGDPVYAAVQPGDPTFKEHLNELYFVIKELKFIPFGPSFRLREIRAIGGDLKGDDFELDPNDELSAFLDSWENDVADIASLVPFGTAEDTGFSFGPPSSGFVINAQSVTFDPAGPPILGVRGQYGYAISSQAELSEVPFPIFQNQPKLFGENNDLPSPYEYGEIHAFAVIRRVLFEQVVTVIGEDETVILASAEEPSFANGVLRVIEPDDLTKASANIDVIDLQEGTEVLAFDIILGVPKAEIGEDEQFVKEIGIASSLLPVADLDLTGRDLTDVPLDELDTALRLWFAGSLNDYSGNPSDFRSPDPDFFFNGVASYSAARGFFFNPIIGFFEITNFAHVDRERDPLEPCFPSGQECST